MRSRTVFFVLSWVIAIALLIVVFSYSLKLSEFADFVSLAERSKPLWILAMGCTEFGTYFSTAMMYRVMLKATGKTVPVVKLLTLNMQKLAVDQLIPTAGAGGYAVISQSLRRVGASKNISIALVIIGLAAWYCAGDITGLFSLWTLRNIPGSFHGSLIVFIVFFVISVLMVTLLTAVRTNKLKRIEHLIPFQSLREFVQEMAQTRELGLPSKKLLATIILLQICLILFDAGTLAFACIALGHPLPYTLVLACYIFSSIAGTLSFLPGGIGVFEGTAIALLGSAGLTPEAALAATLLYRGFSLWLPLLPGVVFARREIHKARLRKLGE